MAPLQNPRHERFVTGLFEGLPASRAFVEAGYAPNDGNAIRLKGNEKVQARLAELQREAARSAKITVQTICAELDEASAVAKSKGQAQAMVSASALRARLAGLMVERVEVGGPGSFEGIDTMAALVDKILADLIEKFKPVDDEDRQGLKELMERHIREQFDFIEEINARPSTIERVDQKNLTRPWKEHETKPYGAARSPRRIAFGGNGASDPPETKRETFSASVEGQGTYDKGER
jgi:phage terminase small subunit